MTSITKFAKERSIAIVEDAAPAIGTLIDGKPAGSFGEFGAYSFQGAKMLVTGEGGMLVTSDPELFERARKIQDHGKQTFGYLFLIMHQISKTKIDRFLRSEVSIKIEKLS
jgi:perosamine synthetase